MVAGWGVPTISAYAGGGSLDRCTGAGGGGGRGRVRKGMVVESVLVSGTLGLRVKGAPVVGEVKSEVNIGSRAKLLRSSAYKSVRMQYDGYHKKCSIPPSYSTITRS